MYSRYTPNASGGFDRRQLPDEADLRAAQGRAPPSDEVQNVGSRVEARESAERRDGSLPSAGPRFRVRRPIGAQTARPQIPQTPGIHPPPPPGFFGGLLGPEGLLGQLLPHGLDTEDLLILAVLLLSMKQDGASPAELLIAVGLYFWL